MSAVNTLEVLSNISIPHEITALATYDQGTLPVYLFIGDSEGGLYIYDISRGTGGEAGYTQQKFTISGITLSAPITGLAVTDQYIFVNSPRNCFQVPLYPFYPTTNYTNNLKVRSVGNCYTRDSANEAGIVATPDSRIVFLSYGASYLSKIYSSDAGNGLITQVAQIPRAYDAYINGVTLDFYNTTVYMSDSKNARMYNYNYSSGANAVLSNIYFVGTKGVEFRGNAYSDYNGTLAYVITNPSGVSGVLGLQIQTQQKYVIASQGTLCNTNAITYDTFGGLYMSTMTPDLSYTIHLNRYIYVERPAPSVAPPKQQQYECGLFLPGSCKRAYVPFNPRERFGWGSPNKPYRTLTLRDIEVSCKLTISSTCPDTLIRGPAPPGPPPPGPQIPVAPPSEEASAQEISRTRNPSSVRVQNLNLLKTLPFNATTNVSPVFDSRGRIYTIVLIGGVGTVYSSDNYASASPVLRSKSIGGTFNTSPACSLTDSTIALGSRQGILTMFDGSSQTIVWQKNLGTSLDLTPSYYAGNVYVAYGSNFKAFSQTDGSIVWSTTALSNGDTYSSSPNIQIGNVFVGTQKGNMYSYSLDDGSVHLRIPANTGPILGSPNLGIDNRIYFGSGSNLFAMNLDRSESASDVIMTTLCGNITSQITLAVDDTRLTRAFFSTALGATGYAQVDTYTQNYPLTNIVSNSVPVLDASYVYVMGKKVPGSNGIVWRYQWNPEVATNTLSYGLTPTSFGPSALVNSSSQLVVVTSTGFLTFS